MLHEQLPMWAGAIDDCARRCVEWRRLCGGAERAQDGSGTAGAELGGDRHVAVFVTLRSRLGCEGPDHRRDLRQVIVELVIATGQEMQA